MTAAMILPLAATPALARIQDQPKLSDFPKEAPAAPQLSEASQQMIHDTFEKARAEDKLLFEAMGHLGGEIHALMGAPGYDHDTFVQKRQELANLKALFEARRTERMASILDKLSPAERKLFASPMPSMLGPMPGMMNGHGPMMQGRPPMMQGQAPMMQGQVPPNQTMPCAKKPAPDGVVKKGMHYRHQRPDGVQRGPHNVAPDASAKPAPVAPPNGMPHPMNEEEN
jgi:hypothetical protein